MKKLAALFFIATIIYSCKNDKKETPVAEKKDSIKIDSTLVTDSSWGPITKTAAIEDLQIIYGAANLKDETICGAECVDSVDVTKIYPGTNNEIVVYWKDSLYHKAINFMQTYNTGSASAYHTASGITVGSTLQDLLKVNGKKITFSGFGWDYGGLIQSFNNGTLEKSSIGFSLNITENGADTLAGDIELNTDMPSVKNYLDKITVSQLSLSFTR